MAETAVRLPFSLDEVITLAKGKPAGGEVELAVRRVIEIPHPGAEPAAGRKGYLLTASFRLQIGEDPYLVDKVYVLGHDDEPQEVTAANRKIANGRLRRDYARLRAADIELAPFYFDEPRAPLA